MIAELIERDEYRRDYGIRCLHSDDPVPEVGSVLPRSVVWDDGDPTDEELTGTCCFAIRTAAPADIADAIRLALDYDLDGGWALVAGNFANDYLPEAGAVVLRLATVLSIL